VTEPDTYFTPAQPGGQQGQPGNGPGGGLVEAIGRFKASADSGQFGISETGGQALIQACRQLKDWYLGQSHKLYMLAQQPKLGSSHMAEVMKPYVQDVATNAKDGFLPVLKQLVGVLDDFETSIQQAMKNYRNTDHEHRQKMNALSGTYHPHEPDSSTNNRSSSDGDTYYV
jgi:hypothetical protein